MSRALKTVGMVLGTAALALAIPGVGAAVGSVIGVSGSMSTFGGAVAGLTMGKIATLASLTATPASLPEHIIAKGPSIEQTASHHRDRGWHGGASRGLDRDLRNRDAGIRSPGREGGDHRQRNSDTAEPPGWAIGTRAGGLAA